MFLVNADMSTALLNQREPLWLLRSPHITFSSLSLSPVLSYPQPSGKIVEDLEKVTFLTEPNQPLLKTCSDSQTSMLSLKPCHSPDTTKAQISSRLYPASSCEDIFDTQQDVLHAADSIQLRVQIHEKQPPSAVLRIYRPTRRIRT